MTTGLVLVSIILLILLIFLPNIIRFIFNTFFSDNRLQLIVTDNEGNGKEKISRLNLHIKIKNTGRNEIEIKAPVLEFIKGKNVRKFQPVLSGNTVFPLILNPKTFHEFNIDINKIIQAKPELKKYNTVKIVFSDKENKIEAVRTFRIN